MCSTLLCLTLAYTVPPPLRPPPLFPTSRAGASNKLNRNYLTGMVLAVGSAVKSLNVAGNFLSGTFPTAALTACDARSNCFVDATKCANTNGTAQRTTTGCNICFSTGTADALCGGGYCMLDAIVPAGAGTPNAEGQALLPMFCQGGPIEINMRGAMLNLKASLGVTFTDWTTASSCTIAGQSPVAGAWSKVVCDTAGKVISIVLESSLLQGRLAYFTTTFKALTALKLLSVAAACHLESYAIHHVFYEPVCCLMACLPCPCAHHPPATCCIALPLRDVSYKYLTGTLPSLGTALKNLRIGGNWLSGNIGTLSGVMCSALFNCLDTQGSCTSGGNQQRPAAGCTICSSVKAEVLMCRGGLCVPDATSAVANGEFRRCPRPTRPSVLSRPLYSIHGTGRHQDGVGGDVHELGGAHNVLKPKAALGSGSVALTDWTVTDGYCTVEGQTPVASSWSGLLCNSLGQPVNLDLSYNFFKCPTLHYPAPPCPTLPHPSPPCPTLPNRAALSSQANPIHPYPRAFPRPLSIRAAPSALFFSYLSSVVRPRPHHCLLCPMLLLPCPPSSHTAIPCPFSFALPPFPPHHPTCSELNLNPLTGTFPATISTALKRLLVDRNFIAGTFPANSATYCTAYGNCISTYTTCNSFYPNSPVGNCNICRMTNVLGTACMSNPCVPVTPSPITATNRWDPMPTMRCVPVPIQATQGNPPIT
ncbi:unnamed protein product [Closterium sp. NIES-65]|nr:unnamed protein product [Closterium sp. NIES-65]